MDIISFRVQPIRSIRVLLSLLLVLLGFAFPNIVYASNSVVRSTNTSGEYSFIPNDALTSEDLSVIQSESSDEHVEENVRSQSAERNVAAAELGGLTRYETSALAALHSFSSADVVLLACGESGYADAIAASGLAGALDAPILLTDVSSIPESTQEALIELSPNRIILLGGDGVISAGVESSLKAMYGEGGVERLGGSTRYDTQMEIYNYGLKNGLWIGNTAIVVFGENYPDALSISPVGFSLNAPVFFTNSSANLPNAQIAAITSASSINKFFVVGGNGVVSDSAFEALSSIADSRGGSAIRLGGSTRYDTNLSIVDFAVSSLGFSWDKAAFATGKFPYDALAGGVAQGKDESILLLIDNDSKACLSTVRQHASEIYSEIRFLGGTGVIPGPLRIEICQAANVSAYGNVDYRYYSLTISQMANLQVERKEPNSYSYLDFYNALNPMKYSYGSEAFLQFAILNNGYSGITAGTINQYVDNNCSYSESTYGRTSNLKNTGDYFIEAANTYGVNEVYLLAHAIWESGWGCSELAGGWTPTQDGEVIVNGIRYPYYKGTTYYNFYGIGAVDANALSGGRAMAVKEGWTSPRAAILGAAEWISENYLNRSVGRQNTLYLMKWDLEGAENNASAWHEYCTGLDTWCVGISRIMCNCYSLAGFSFSTAPLKFEVPVFHE